MPVMQIRHNSNAALPPDQKDISDTRHNHGRTLVFGDQARRTVSS